MPDTRFFFGPEHFVAVLKHTCLKCVELSSIHWDNFLTCVALGDGLFCQH
jgi:hypothetical protein